MNDFEVDADVNEYLQEFLNDISDLSPEIHNIFLEIQKNDYEIEEILKSNRLMENQLWDLMDGVSSEDSDDSEEDTEWDDDKEVDENEYEEIASRRLNKRRRIEVSEIRRKTRNLQKEQELKEIVRSGYEKAIELSEVKCILVTKALNLVKRYSKQINDDFAAFFPDHTLPEYSDISERGSFVKTKDKSRGKKRTAARPPPEKEDAYKGAVDYVKN
ncbi:3232_t:CDS:2 [Ambispora gerdemannii]|uniref:3232_t:CDS:1 n=1 Tax=Ambispora gerdemannii TaxID=144530 RepID=A0A9N9A805_9GLOM|nr:3232_t:CDS:2 [Ambispora gerdemannii]